MSRKDLPAPSTSNWAQRVTEEVRVLMGKMGNKADQALTISNLPALGGLIPGGIGGGSGGGAYEPDLTPPPMPTGFALSAAISHVFIEHDAPLYLQGHGHARTILYGAKVAPGDPLPTFSTAVELAQFQGAVYAYPSDPATTWRMWIKWVTVDGVESTVPAGGTNGLAATTGQDVALLLDALTGQITESELYSTLGTRINLIDGSGPGSVNARVATESSTRSSADGYLGAQQNVRVDIAGHVSGYGIAGSSPDGTGASATSAFGVRANQFFVAPPSLVQATAPTADLYDGFVWVDTSVVPNLTRYRSGGTWTLVPPMLPFVIQTTPTTINGVPVPAGVYMRDAFILNGTITNAKLGNLAADDAKIANLSVSKILAGSMVIGQFINSANYISGVQGWSINAAGNAEFSNATIRGTVYAGAGSIGGIIIAGNAVYSSNYSWDGAGFYLGADGNIYANSVRLRGSVMGGSFSGYAWPASGTGYYLGPEGLLVGNPAGGRYFQLDTFGNVYAPGFSIVNGSAYFNGSGTFNGNGTFTGNLSAVGGTFSGTLTASAINAVNTINIAGEAVTTLTAYSGGPTFSDGFPGLWISNFTFQRNFPSGGSGILVLLQVIGNSAFAGSDVTIRLKNSTTGAVLCEWEPLMAAHPVSGTYMFTSASFGAEMTAAVGLNTYVLETTRTNDWFITFNIAVLTARR